MVERKRDGRSGESFLANTRQTRANSRRSCFAPHVVAHSNFAHFGRSALSRRATEYIPRFNIDYPMLVSRPNFDTNRHQNHPISALLSLDSHGLRGWFAGQFCLSRPSTSARSSAAFSQATPLARESPGTTRGHTRRLNGIDWQLQRRPSRTNRGFRPAPNLGIPTTSLDSMGPILSL